MTPWNKGKTGYMGANITSFRKGDNKIELDIRFWQKVDKQKECWVWVGSLNNKGYGRINIGGIIKLAHRVSYEIAYGKIPSMMSILHKCDNPPCVNPNHLQVGTHKENIEDMIEKGRGCVGEGASYAKLNYQKVVQIKGMYKQSKISQRALAKLFKVSQCTISLVVNEKRWSN